MFNMLHYAEYFTNIYCGLSRFFSCKICPQSLAQTLSVSVFSPQKYIFWGGGVAKPTVSLKPASLVLNGLKVTIISNLLLIIQQLTYKLSKIAYLLLFT